MTEEKNSFETQALGKLYIHPLRMGNYVKLSEKFNFTNPPKSEDFVRNLILFVCSPEEKGTPELPCLNLEDVGKLGGDELDEFSKKYIEANDHLYRKQISKTKEENGKKIFTIESGEVQYPKEETESNINYLTRLFGLYKKYWMVQMSQSSEALGAFSKSLQMQIANTLSFGSSLAGILKAANSPFMQMVDFYKKNSPHIKDINPIMPIISKTEIPNIPIPRNYELETLRELSEKMANSNEYAEKLVAFIVLMNETQTAIAAELKQSGNSAKKFAIGSLIVSLVVVLLTIYSIYSSSLSTNNQNNLIKNASIEMAARAKEANEISRELLNATNENSKNIARILKENNAKINNLTERLKKSQTDQAELNEQILNLQARIEPGLQQDMVANMELMSKKGK